MKTRFRLGAFLILLVSLTARASARQNPELHAEALARLARARQAIASRDYQTASAELERARHAAQTNGNTPLEVTSLGLLGHVTRQLGDRNGAIQFYDAAFRRLPDAGPPQQAMDFIRTLVREENHLPEKEYLLNRAATFAATLALEPQVAMLKLWSDTLLAEGDLAGALEKLQRAAALLDSSSDRTERAGLLVSMGKLYRSHGNRREAIEYFEKALEIHRQSGDRVGESRILQFIGVTYLQSNERRKGLEFLEEALAAAQGVGRRPAMVNRLTMLGFAYVQLGEFARAIDLLERLKNDPRGGLSGAGYAFLSRAYLAVGRVHEAREAADAGVALAREHGIANGLMTVLFRRAEAWVRLGRIDEAVADATESLSLLEQIRARLVPTDFMKQGFNTQYLEEVRFVIDLLFQARLHREAFEVAETARARAFLDLLGTRNVEETDIADVDTETLDTPPLLGGETNLLSSVSVPPATAEHAAALAARTKSQVLAYWVNPDALYIWLVDANGNVTGARENLPEDRLKEMTDRANSKKTESIAAWRDLYRHLIEPVRTRLAKPGSRLTIVPHGDLFKLSFAALQDANGRYLIEDYALVYAPAIATFDLVDEHNKDQRSGPARYLLMADPSTPPRLTNGAALPPLGGSRMEVQNINTLVGAAGADTLTGAALRLDAVRRSLDKHSVVHFATHAIIDANQPLDSFLALSAGERLTVREVYDIPMNADLVMLSACRSATGPISPEGVLGLARAFFYAGARSVVASTGDVPDEPAAALVSAFYQEYRRSGAKDHALRAAQLRLLADLRAGRVESATPAGRMKLPEHPSLWSGLILIGSPE